MKKTQDVKIYSMSVSPVIQTCIVSIILTAVITFMLWNTSGLNTVLENSTNSYVKDASFQQANDISSKINSFELALELLSDSIKKLPNEDLLEEFLNRKAEILDFDSLILLDKNNKTIPSNTENLNNLSGIKNSYNGEKSITYIEGQSLVFSVPVESNGEINQVLAGVCKKENIQNLIAPKSFNGSGLSCIIDNNGKVVISPTDVKPFIQLDSIFMAKDENKTKNAIEEMKSHMSSGEPGVFNFTSVNNSRLVLSYHPLGINNWVLLTLVPADLISGEANNYILRSFIIVGIVVLIFALFLIIIFRYYRKSENRLKKFAFSDSLTGGLNNSAFQLECQKLISESPPMTYTVIMMNIKGFKLINLNYGIETGNDTIRYIHKVLSRHIKEDEMITRSEADHFFLCLKESDKNVIQKRIDEMTADINSYAQNSDIPHNIKISQGAYIVEEPGLNIRMIQDRARTACQLQNKISDCSFYNSEITNKMIMEQKLCSLFDDSIKNNDFHVYIQPKINLKNSETGGAEALVRWFHPDRGIIYPSDFIPLFERNGNIIQLDLYVFEKVYEYQKQRIDSGKKLFTISVNLSRVHFRNLNYLRPFIELKNKYNIPDGVIELELTESIFFDNQQIELVKNAINQMHSYGFLCSLDDFGVGFSSLGLLKEFNVDAIKLDRKFFEDITNSKSQNIIISFIDLAKRLNIHVVAEGIETSEQLNFLKSVNCDMVQGYIFSKPLPLNEFEKWADSRENKCDDSLVYN